MWGILIYSFFGCMLNYKFISKLLMLVSMMLFCIVKKSFVCVKNLWSLDQISALLIFLSGLIIFFSLIYKYKFGLKILLFSLILFFCSKNSLLFYLFFELSVLPAFYLMFSLGKNPERIEALNYLIMYTMIGSFPFIFVLMKKINIFWSFFDLFKKKEAIVLLSLKEIGMLFITLAFFIKLPLFGLHKWLPKAHVEAPTQGSMMLAALLLKMGSYGLYRFGVSELNIKTSNLLMGWMLFSLVIVSFFCFRISDMKVLIAFSSVNHMLLVAFSWLFLSNSALLFSLFLGMSHGFLSSGLFFLMGNTYDKSKSRSIFFKTGLKNMFSIMKVFWLLLLVGNCSAPTSLSLFSEIYLFNHLVQKMFSYISLVLFVFFSGLYCMYLYSITFHGDLKQVVSFKQSFLQNSKLICITHMMYSFLFVFYLVFFF